MAVWYERLLNLASTRLYLVEEPHVLDRDHGLVGEDLEQSNLLIGKGERLRAANDNRAYRLVFAEQRDSNRRPVAEAQRHSVAVRELVALRPEVLHVDGPPLKDRTSGEPAPSECKSVEGDRDRSAMRGDVQPVAVP